MMKKWKDKVKDEKKVSDDMRENGGAEELEVLGD